MCNPNTPPRSDAAVILVDDDPAVLSSLSFSLRIEGHCVHAYHSAEALFDQGLPDCGCLVIDYALPGMNGLDLIDSLRAKGVTSPAILIVSSPNRSIHQRATAADVPVIEKPLLGNGLLEAIRHALDRA